MISLLYQRRWERIADVIEGTTRGAVLPVVMPYTEGGGILVIKGAVAYHFHNSEAMVNVDIWCADNGRWLEARENCFRFDQPLGATVTNVMGELAFM